MAGLVPAIFVMLRESGASSSRYRFGLISMLVFTGSSAFADDDKE
jgi:hypothetical protein